MVISLFFNFKMWYNNINLLPFIVLIALINEHFHFHSNAKLLIL